MPKLGRRFPGLLHASLSISAYHLARVELQDAPHYMRQGEHHYEIVVRNATAMIADLTIRNCQAFYALAVMICFISFARKPSPGDLMLVSRDGCTSSLQLIRGVRSVIGTFGSSVIFSGFLAPNEIIDDDGQRPNPLEEEAIRDKRRRRVEIAFPGWKWQDGLDRLQMQLQTTPPSPAEQVLRETVASMRRCFESICESLPPTHGRKDADFVSVMRWVYESKDTFIQLLNGGNRVALVLVGYFGICLEVLEGFWWLEGWGRHILRELKGMLLDEYEVWLPHAR